MLNKNYGYILNDSIVYAPSTFRVVIHHSDSYVDPETGETIINEWVDDYIELHPELHPESYENAYPNPFYPIEDNPPSCDYYHQVVHKSWTFDEERKVNVHNYEIVDKVFTRDDYDRAMEDHIHKARVDRGYTTREPSAYAESTVPRFKQDAIDWQNFIDSVMLYALDIINKVDSGESAPSLKEFIKNLPTCIWTENNVEEN